MSDNDRILRPFLCARDNEESERQLAILLTDHAIPLTRGIIRVRLRFYFSNYNHYLDFEDLCSEVNIKLLAYLEELKAHTASRPCKDFRSYLAVITHNACNDYLRQIYPARTRLYKQVRDLLRAHPDFAIWKSEDENTKSDWMCGFEGWQRRKVTSRLTDWMERFCEDWRAVTDRLASASDYQLMELDDLLAAILDDVGEPIYVNHLVSIIADIRGIKDLPAISFDSQDDSPAQNFSDSKLRIDTLLEMRELLKLVWEGLRQLRREEFRVYLLHARDVNGEDLISLFVDAKIVSESEMAQSLGIQMEEFRDLRQARLPLDNESIARELGIKVERVYKLRFQAIRRLRKFLSAKQIKI